MLTEAKKKITVVYTGYAFLIDGGAVSWSSKQQELIVLSTTEGEYVAATHAAKEALWLRSFISEVFGSNLESTTLFSDNQSAIALSRDHQYHARTKHIDIRYHFIRWVIDNGSIRLIYCPTEDMIADTLTKPLPSTKGKALCYGSWTSRSFEGECCDSKLGRSQAHGQLPDTYTACRSGIDVESDETTVRRVLTGTRPGIPPSEPLERLVSDRYEGMWSQVMSSTLSTL